MVLDPDTSYLNESSTIWLHPIPPPDIDKNLCDKFRPLTFVGQKSKEDGTSEDHMNVSDFDKLLTSVPSDLLCYDLFRNVNVYGTICFVPSLHVFNLYFVFLLTL